MKKLIVMYVLFGLFLGTLFAAMSDPQARRRARELWGDIGALRIDPTTTTVERQVGYNSKGCGEPFTVVGRGNGSWDAAFADALTKQLDAAGPFTGLVTVKIRAFDNASVKSIRPWIDSVPYAEQFPANPEQEVTIEFPLNASALKDGLHVLCITALDTWNNEGRSRPHLFRTGGIAYTPEWTPQRDPGPSLSIAEFR